MLARKPQFRRKKDLAPTTIPENFGKFETSTANTIKGKNVQLGKSHSNGGSRFGILFQMEDSNSSYGNIALVAQQVNITNQKENDSPTKEGKNNLSSANYVSTPSGASSEKRNIKSSMHTKTLKPIMNLHVQSNRPFTSKV